MTKEREMNTFDRFHSGWEGISHVLESNELTIVPDETGNSRQIGFDPLPERLEFLIQAIRVRGLPRAAYKDGKWIDTSEFELSGYIHLQIGAKNYICDLPIALCFNQWHEITPNLRLIPTQTFEAMYSSFKFVSLQGGKPITSRGREVPVTNREGAEHVEKLDRLVWSGIDAGIPAANGKPEIKGTGQPAALYTFTAKPREKVDVEF